MFKRLLGNFYGIIRKLKGAPQAPAARPVDPRVAADPWLSALLLDLGERYRIGEDAESGTQLLRRTGRARFNPMRVWLRPGDRTVLGDYEVRAHDAAGVSLARALLDARVTQALAGLGLSQASETVEEWAGQLLTRRYEGRCDDPRAAAAAVRFICEESEQQLDTAAE